MKVIALLSGGKDSIYNLHHCILNYHEPVCVASLGPPEGQDELDSFMYQTVAHSGLATLAEALDLPFFSTAIKGKPLNQSSEYGSRSRARQPEDEPSEGGATTEDEQDETEDLYKLLKMVQTAMPEVEGVAAGAILSNYQRVRVEHVCARLGLVPIAYLWQRDQRELLNEMVVSGQESVLVKVAGAGLGVQHLGKTLAEMQPVLHRLNERFETHVCGEGGEYETFTLDSPIFKKRIVLDETQTIVSNPDPHSTVAHLYLSRLSLEDKPGHPSEESFDGLRERLARCVTVPAVLDEDSETVRAQVCQIWGDDKGTESLSQTIKELDLGKETPTVRADVAPPAPPAPSVSVVDGWLNFSSISAVNETDASAEELSIEDELSICFERLIALLSSHSASLLSISHLTLLLSRDSMPLFPRINKIYSRYFGTSPPTRACVATHFASHDRARVKVEGVARLREDSASEYRTALHVQSLSYWGAANIGPYSQAVTVGNRCYIAGQIPLVPCSLALPIPANFPLEVALSLQHVRRIVIAAAEGRWKGWMEGGVVWIAEQSCESLWKHRVEAARVGWRTRGVEGVKHPVAPIVFVSAAELPRSASIEWQVTWQTGQVPWKPEEDAFSSDEEGSERDRDAPGKVETEASEIIKSTIDGKILTWQCSAVCGIADSVVGILGCSIDERGRPAGLNNLGPLHSIKAFHQPHITTTRVRLLAQSLFCSSSSPSRHELPSISFIASRSIDTLEAAGSHDVAFVVVACTLEG
ncbi:hypothetical protein JCM3766R1_002538 [Sporobolomyces carnicolor]